MAEQLARPGNGYILAVTGVDERRVVAEFKTSPASKDRGKVVLRVVTEVELCSLFKMKVYIALQVDSAGQPLACRNQHLSASCGKTGFNSLLERLAVLRLAVTFCSVFTNVKSPILKLWALQLWHFERRTDFLYFGWGFLVHRYWIFCFCGPYYRALNQGQNTDSHGQYIFHWTRSLLHVSLLFPSIDTVPAFVAQSFYDTILLF
ncbi:hypothetical protein ES703_63894 [subsurface metagenome]